MKVRVWVASIGVAFAICPRVELSAAERQSFEVERQDGTQMTPERAAMSHDDWLREVALGVIAVGEPWVHARRERDRLGAEPEARARGVVRFHWTGTRLR